MKLKTAVLMSNVYYKTSLIGYSAKPGKFPEK